jgi:DNA-binding MarR family transcriptional regulator
MTTIDQTHPKKSPARDNPPAEAALRNALAAQPNATAAELAAAAGLGRSTVSKKLALLEQAGQIRRDEGGREGGGRVSGAGGF